MNKDSSTLLTQVEDYLRQQVAPKACQLDQDPQALCQAMVELGKLQLLGLRVSQRWGGQGIDKLTYLRFQELVSRYSGSLAFLQTQHQSAASMLAASRNEELKEQVLADVTQGTIRVGVGFSQLRRQGKPPMKAIAIDQGYQLHGEIPWITGFGCFQYFVVGALLPDGQAVFGLVPFAETTQPSGGTITFSDPLKLAAMESTNTVKGFIHEWFLPKSQVVSVKPPGWIQTNDQLNMLKHSFFSLGCAQAGLDIMITALAKLPPFAEAAWQALDQKLVNCRTEIYQAQQSPQTLATDRLRLRAEAIDLAVRCTHAAVTVTRGSANYSYHPAQRVYREALALTVFGQTTAVMEATLARLSQM